MALGGGASFHGDGRYPGDGGTALEEPWWMNEGHCEASPLHGVLKGGLQILSIAGDSKIFQNHNSKYGWFIKFIHMDLSLPAFVNGGSQYATGDPYPLSDLTLP